MAAEVALALMLLAGGALLWKSFVRVTGVDLGFQPDRVLVMLVNLPDVRYPDAVRRLAFFQELEQRVSRMPGVQAAAYTFRFPMRGGWGSAYQTPDGPGSESRRLPSSIKCSGGSCSQMMTPSGTASGGS
jgi:hypothetical protein